MEAKLDGYYIVWLDGDLKIIDADTWINKDTEDAAMRYAARRFLQSPHLVPRDATGFCIMNPLQWKLRRLQKT